MEITIRLFSDRALTGEELLAKFKDFLDQQEESASDALDSPEMDLIETELGVAIGDRTWILDASMKDDEDDPDEDDEDEDEELEPFVQEAVDSLSEEDRQKVLDLLKRTIQ